MTRRFQVTALLGFLSVGVGACSLVYDLSDYSGGTVAKDSGVVDTGNVDTSPVDTGTEGDSTVVDSGDDTNVAETAVETSDDTNVAETGGEAGGDTGDATSADGDSALDSISIDSTADSAWDGDAATDTGPSCTGTLCLFGVSEIMVHPVSGSLGADKHEWVEITNYDSAPVDVSGVTVKVFASTEKASFTFPTGTTVAGGDSVVVADDDTLLKGDVVAPFTLGTVFAFKSTGDTFVNSTVTVRLYAPSSTTPYETAAFSRSAWPTGRSFAYPAPPAAACPPSARFVGGVPGASWKDVPVDISQKYGEFPAGTPLYGTPTKANAGVACP